LLRPFDFETLGTTAYSLANQGRIFETATPSLILILLSGLSLLLVEFFGWKRTPTPRQS
jgi:ABC-type Fe3+ transport system permease subunit